MRKSEWQRRTDLAAERVSLTNVLCGKTADARGFHGLAFQRSACRQQRHYHLNDIIWRALKRAQIHALKEPVGLMRQDGKRVDGFTILLWSRGKPLTWDVTVPDTFAEAHVANSARQADRHAGTAANLAANNKATEYDRLTRTHVFCPVAIETAGTWHQKGNVVSLQNRLLSLPSSPLQSVIFYFYRAALNAGRS